MVRSKYLLVLLIFLGACAESDSPIEPSPAKGIVGLWQYEYLVVADSLETPFANNRMEPGTYKGTLGGERAEINRRQVRYFKDGTYQLLWLDRGSYQLGTEDSPNWQPSYGLYQVSAGDDSLWHNAPFYYAYPYSIRIDGDTLIRTSQRYMSSNSRDFSGAPFQSLWNSGDRVEYKEVFIRLPE